VPESSLIVDPRVDEAPGAIRKPEVVLDGDALVEPVVVILQVDHAAHEAAFTKNAALPQDRRDIRWGNVLERVRARDDVDSTSAQAGCARVTWGDVTDAEPA
jgi:hypothetical protein